jgi:hypothetical protein
MLLLLSLAPLPVAAAGGTGTGGPGLQPPAAPTTSASFRDWFGRPPVDRNPRAWQKSKNGRVALFSSLLIPGLGQLYNEREFWALVAAGVEFYFIGDIIVQQRLTNKYRALKNLPIDPDDPAQVAKQQEYTVLFLLHRDNRLQSTWLLGLTVLLSGLQAYVDAHLFDFDAVGDVRFEALSGEMSGGAVRLRF